MDELLMEKAAFEFRTECGINAHDSIRLKSLLQKLNVITVFKDLAEDFSGMALKASTDQGPQRFMLVNSKHPLGKQHFTICHELYHLFKQPLFSSRVCNTGLFNPKDKEEYRADLFASYVLLPKDGLLEYIPAIELSARSISLKTIVFLEQFFTCSRRALLYRLKKLQLISTGQYNQYSEGVRRSALEYGYSTHLYEPGNNNTVIGGYGTLAKDLYDQEMISQSHYITLLSDIGIDLQATNNQANDKA